MADKPLVIGLTGQTGAGKTTVSEAFRKNGYAIINADLVAREVTGDPAIAARLGELFGENVLTEDGILDRKALAAIVFSDKDELLKLNTILYPIIVKKIGEKIEELSRQGKTRILLDAPTLFESGANKLCTKTVAVLADAEIRKQRIMARDNLTEQEALRRMSSQYDDLFYRSKASFTIRNDHSPAQLEKDAQPLIDRLEKSKNSELRPLLIGTAAFAACILLIWGFFLLVFRIQYPQKYQDQVLQAAREFNASPSLIYAVMKADSGFDPDFQTDEQQGMFPLTVRQFEQVCTQYQWEADFDDLLNPDTSIRFGAAFLGAVARDFPADRAIFSVYYGGEEQTRLWLADPEYSDDGIHFQNIPEKSVREHITKAEGAQLLYQKLYRLD